MNVIRTDAIKAKVHNKLYVSQNDLVSSTLKQINEFEYYYFKLLDKVIRLTKKLIVGFGKHLRRNMAMSPDQQKYKIYGIILSSFFK